MAPQTPLPSRPQSKAKMTTTTTTTTSNNHLPTIFMTPEESHRIRTTVQTRLKKCLESHDQPRKPRDRQQILSAATQAALMADMSGESAPGTSTTTTTKSDREDALVALTVGIPFPPCVEKLENLTPMDIAELRIDRHHRGRVLRVRRARVRVRFSAPVVPLRGCSWTVVEDGRGEVERLEVVLHREREGEDVLDGVGGGWFWVKEPWFTIDEQGEATIRVYHPSDLIRGGVGVGDGDGVVGWSQRKWKERGNVALKKREWGEALGFYTQGLRATPEEGEDDISCDIHRNRAHVNLLLGRFDQAKTDGIAAITGIADEKHRLLDSKAHFRAGSAAYSLGEFDEAQKLFQAAVSLSPEDKDAQTYLRNIEARRREQQTGEYNFTKLRLKLSPARPRLDAATFSARIHIDSSPLGGRGMFAKENIPSGSLVLCEKAFRVAWSHEGDAWTAMTFDVRDEKIRAFPAGLAQVVVRKLLDNPSQIPAVMALFGDWRSFDDTTGEVVMGEDGPVVDTFQIHDIVCRNAFGPGPPVFDAERSGGEDARCASTGLWLMAAAANHSCLANCVKEFVGDLLIFRAERDILAGEEITHCYDGSSDYEIRQGKLETTWGFRCRCGLCEVEEGDGVEVRRRRRELEGEVAALVEREDPLKKRSVLKAERLEREIAATYDEERYRGLPRFGLVSIRSWLERAGRK